MGWLQRLFGLEKPETEPATVEGYSVPAEPQEPDIPPERLGLEGEYDDSGLAKRVALAFDQDPELPDLHSVWVAQTGTTVVLKGNVPSQDELDKLVEIARSVYGAGDVTTDEVTVGA